LNARYGAFCSALPQLDAPFGSLGSFFDLAPDEVGWKSCRAPWLQQSRREYNMCTEIAPSAAQPLKHEL
jgi:hypothetical protein